MLTRKTAPHEKWARRKPPDTGPIAIPSPDTPAQIAIALARSPAGNTFVRIESVDGMMNAAPTPIRARVEISAVAQRACREQDSGEDEQVRVDDPLELRGRGVQIGPEARDRDVEDRVVETDHEQRERENAQRPPAAAVDGFGRGGHVGSFRNATVSFRIELHLGA